MGAVVIVLVFLVAGTCWMVVRNTGMEKEDDAEQEELRKQNSATFRAGIMMSLI